MEKTSRQEEYKFLEEYFKFYSKKNGKNIGGFIAFAEKTLVTTGQISKDTLSAFEMTYHLQIELEKKEVQVKVLRDEIVALKNQINKNSSTSTNYSSDGCSGGGGGIRGGC